MLEELVLSSNYLTQFDTVLWCGNLKYLGLKSNRLIDFTINSKPADAKSVRSDIKNTDYSFLPQL
jgi:hypothetical protein